MNKIINNKYLSFIKEHITIIIITVTILGGLGQFLKLFSLSSNLLIFFSATQAVLEGVIFIIYLAIIFLIFFINICIIILLKDYSTKKAFLIITSIILFTINLFLNNFLLKSDFNFFYLSMFSIIIYIIILFRSNDFFKEYEDYQVEEKRTPSVLYFISITMFCFLSFIYYYQSPIYSTNFYKKNNIENIDKTINNDKGETYYLEFMNDKFLIYKNYENDKFIIHDLNEKIKK